MDKNKKWIKVEMCKMFHVKQIPPGIRLRFPLGLRRKIKIYWIFFLIAGLCEIVWTVSLKLSNEFSKLSYSILTVLFLIVSFVLLALALKKTSSWNCLYNLDWNWCCGNCFNWCDFLQEPLEILRGLCLIFILFGIIGLKVL